MNRRHVIALFHTVRCDVNMQYSGVERRRERVGEREWGREIRTGCMRRYVKHSEGYHGGDIR